MLVLHEVLAVWASVDAVAICSAYDWDFNYGHWKLDIKTWIEEDMLRLAIEHDICLERDDNGEPATTRILVNVQAIKSICGRGDFCLLKSLPAMWVGAWVLYKTILIKSIM